MNITIDGQKDLRARRRVAKKFPKGNKSDGKTRQEFKDECDINNIMSRYRKDGIVTHINVREPQYGIVPAVDFHAAMNLVTDAQQTFETLDSSIRKKFGNSIENFLEFVENPDNTEAMEEMGLLTPSEPEEDPSEGQTAPPENEPPADAEGE